MNKIMKAMLIAFSVFAISFGSTLDVLALLKSKDWDKISEGIVAVTNNADSYKKNIAICQEISELIHQQTEHLRNHSVGMPKIGDSGEIVLDILSVALKMDVTAAIPDLMDWVNNVPPCSEYIAKHMVAEGCKKSRLLDTLLAKATNDEVFYRERQNGYLEIVVIAADKDTTCVLFKSVAHAILLKVLRATDPYQRLDAVRSSKLFSQDPEIGNILDSLMIADSYQQKRKSKIVFPVREAAKAILEGKQK